MNENAIEILEKEIEKYKSVMEMNRRGDIGMQMMNESLASLVRGMELSVELLKED